MSERYFMISFVLSRVVYFTIIKATTRGRGRLIVFIIFNISCKTGLPSDIEMFLNCGANKVLLKPLDLDALGQAMKDMMT